MIRCRRSANHLPHCLAAVTVALGVAVPGPAGVDSAQDAAAEQRTVEQLKELQTNIAFLAQVFDRALLDGMQMYPEPDWYFLGNEALRTERYDDLRLRLGASAWDRSLAERLDRTRLHYHWDVLRNWAVRLEAIRPESLREFSYITPERARALNQGQTFYDPFTSAFTLGYVATEHDFLLISEGPDKDSDILPFAQWSSGGYHSFGVGSDVERAVTETIGGLYGTEYRGTRPTELIVDKTKWYDPTNGIISDGDIVFHRRGGDDFMYSFQGNNLLETSNFVFRDLSALLPDEPAGSETTGEVLPEEQTPAMSAP